MPKNQEKLRLSQAPTENKNWKQWGPYLADRQWSTVREDYSADGNAWDSTTHDLARSKAYRWGEEGIGGICDDKQLICFALSFWNGKDPILKERFYGLSGNEGNHGEDVKENYYYLDSTPTHSYMKMLYKYPQSEFPYGALIENNKNRNRQEAEYELNDTGIFDSDQYFDVFIEYAKNNETDILIKITVHNRSKEAAILDLIPQIWFRNTWSWGYDVNKPLIGEKDAYSLVINHKKVGLYHLYSNKKPEFLFTNNETNIHRLGGLSNDNHYFKDGINDYIVNDKKEAVNPNRTGTKAAARFHLNIAAKDSKTVLLRLSNVQSEFPFLDYHQIFETRLEEANTFYADLQLKNKNSDANNIQRQALAGMLWSKQFYYFDISKWLKGDPAHPEPPKTRFNGRNNGWTHV